MSDIEKISVNGTEYDINGEKLAHKAEIDGAYEQMTVGNAEQLVGTTFEEDSVPYNFRTSGGSIDIGDREYDELVGGTVAWNQLMSVNSAIATYTKLGVTLTRASNEPKWTINGTYEQTAGDKNFYVYSGTPISFLKNHVYMLATTSKYFKIYTYGVLSNALNFSVVVKASDNGNGSWCFNSNDIADGTAINETASVNVFDLTQMFGTTVADYIYSLETANAGAGVAFFRKLFPKPYYAYNAGQLMSVNASSHNTTGFNQWDEEWELGGIGSSDGVPYPTPNAIRAKNFSACLPNTTYYFKGTFAVYWYDNSQAFIKVDYAGNNTKVSPENARYFKIGCYDSYGTTYNHDICVNLSWDGERDGEYEPYVKHSYPLDSDLELRGIPKLDASDNLYYDGDTYESDGTVTRKWGFYTIQTSDITFDDGGGYTNVVCAKIQNLPDMLKTNTKQAIHSKYGVAQVVLPFDNTSNIGKFANNPATQAYWFIFPVGTTIEQMRTALSGTTIVYELATPTTEEADPYQNPQIVDDFGTEEYVDAGVTASTPTRDVAIPVGHNTKYQPNLRAKLEMLPNSPDGDGDYLMRQSNGENSFVPFVKELPALPSEDGTYVLKCTVSGSTKTLGWVEEE